MAAGDMHVFDEHLEALWNERHNEADTLKAALIQSNANGGLDPAETDADPTWGAGGTTNYAAAEVTETGNYTAGGVTLTSVTVTEAAGTVSLNATVPGGSPTWAQNASNPPDARTLVIYNDTDTNKACIAYMDLGADIDMTAGDLTVSFAGNVIYTSTTTAGT